MRAVHLKMPTLLQSDARTRPNRWLIASLTLHAALLALFLVHRAVTLAPAQLPGSTHGHRYLLTYSPGSAAPPLPAPKPQPPTPHPAVPPSPATTSAGTGVATGNDALGQGDTTIALVLNHPPPVPDLSRLPSGTRGDVIVDVLIDQTGHIAKFTMTRGLGHGVDDTVLATIQGWTFQPATRNGLPVPSEQELLFHYEHS